MAGSKTTTRSRARLAALLGSVALGTLHPSAVKGVRGQGGTTRCHGGVPASPALRAFLETGALLPGSRAIAAAAGCPPPSTDERGVTRPQGAECDIGPVEVSPVTSTTTTTLAPPEVWGNCADDDGDGLTDYGDPACCTETAAMQVKVLIVPGPAGAMKAHLSLTAIPAQAGFADVDPTRDDVTVQFHNPNGELQCATVPHQRWKRASRRGPFDFGDPAWTVAQGLRKMQIIDGHRRAAEQRGEVPLPVRVPAREPRTSSGSRSRCVSRDVI